MSTYEERFAAARAVVEEGRRNTTAARAAAIMDSRRSSPRSPRPAAASPTQRNSTARTAAAASPRNNTTRQASIPASATVRSNPASPRMSLAERRAMTAAAIKRASVSAPSSPSRAPPRESTARSVASASSPRRASASSRSRPTQAPAPAPAATAADAAQSEAATSADLHALMAQFVAAQEVKFNQLQEQLKNEYDDKIAQLELQVYELQQGCKCDCGRQLAAVVDTVATLETMVSGVDTKLLGLVEDVDAKICRVQAQAAAVEADVKVQINSMKMHTQSILAKANQMVISPLSLFKEPTRVQWTCPANPTTMVWKNGAWKEAASIPSSYSSSAGVEVSGVSQHSTESTGTRPSRFTRCNGPRDGLMVFG